MSGVPLLSTIVIFAVMGTSQDAAKPEGAAAQFTAGEVIVKFTGSSKAGEMVQQALQADTKPDAQLAAYLSSLSEEIGIPFQARQLTSGGEAVLSVQERGLISKVSEQLKRNYHVEKVQELDSEEKIDPMRTRTYLLVKFHAGSRLAKAVASSPGNTQLSDPDLQEFISKVEQKLGFAVVARVTEKQEFLLSVDVKALTLELVERLKKRTDVQYAQPNFVLQKLGRPILIFDQRFEQAASLRELRSCWLPHF